MRAMKSQTLPTLSDSKQTFEMIWHSQRFRRLRMLGLAPFFVVLMLAMLFSMMGVNLSLAQAGTTYYVTPSGTANACSEGTPCHWTTALGLATDGAEIRFAEGVYAVTETMTINQAITLTGGFDPADWTTSDPLQHETVLDGGNARRMMELSSPTAVLVQGFTFQNGSASGVGGGGLSSSGVSTVRNNIFRDNSSSSTGGALSVDGGTAVIENNAIYQNQAAVFGGGLYFGNSASVTVSGNAIYSNTTPQSGAGLASFSITDLTFYNNLVYGNQANTDGGGLFLFGGTNVLLNNTIYANQASSNGGGISVAGGSVGITNTIVTSNTGVVAGVFNNGGTVFGAYNNVHNNSNSATVNLTNGISGAPQFLNAAAFNLRLAETSPNVDAGDPNTPAFINVDFDGQARPNPDGADPTRVDVGADEFYADVPDFSVIPILIPDHRADRETVEMVNHTLANIGTADDSYTFEISNDLGWTVTAPMSVNDLAAGQTTSLVTLINVPADAAPLSRAETTITATSALSPTLQKVVTILSQVQPRPGVLLTPVYSETLTPGEPVTLTHVVTNTGDSMDTITIDLIPDPWADLALGNPFSVTLVSGASRNVELVVTVPAFAEQGIVRELTLTAVSSFSPTIQSTVVNTITAKATVGTRFVALDGSDTDNNCTQSDMPCRTLSHAVGQAASGDEIHVQEGGTYVEGEMNINESIQISGGWTADFSEQKENPRGTIIDGNGERIFNIAPGSSVQPSFNMLTLQNGASTQGGAVFVGQNSQPNFVRVVFRENISSQGGAIYIDNGFVSIRQSEFLTNTTTGQGGAIYHNAGLIREIENSLFAANTAVSGGALAINNHAGTVDLLNNTFAFNQATGGSGGAIFSNNGTLNVRNQAVISNTATSGAGGIHVSTATANVTYSDIFGNGATQVNGNVTLGAGVINEEPIFVDGYRPGSGSPLADSGDPLTTLTEDFEGDFRPTDQGYDMGYDERVGCTAQRDDVIYGSIQDAIQAPDPTSSLILVSGVCRGVNTAVLNGQTISQTVLITDSVQIQGGWNSDFSEFTNDPTIIDPEGLGRGIFISDTVETSIENMFIVNGDATGLGGGPADEDAGGNLYNLSGTAVFTGVRVLTGTATLGGGFYSAGGSTQFDAWEPIAAQADNFDEFPNRFAANSATQGGAFYAYQGTVTFNAAHVEENSATDGAGGFNQTAVLSVTNVIFDENIASGNGGAFYNEATSASFLHNTVYSNTAVTGGGVYNASGSLDVLSNIFESNQATTDPAISVAGGTVSEDYNYFFDQTAPAPLGANSIDSATPPGLTDPANDDFNVEDDAPVVDAGDPDSPVQTDYLRDPRPTNLSSDIGADELAGCSVDLNGVRYGSIQVALELAEPGDEIKVSGTCSGVQQVDLGAGGVCGIGVVSLGLNVNKDVTITGGWDEDFQMREPQNVTTIDAEGLGTAVYFAPGTAATLDQFHIINGAAANGAGVCSDNASPTLLNSEIYSNTATTSGGGIYAEGGAPRFDLGNRLYLNSATSGGGVYIANTNPAVTTLQNSFVYSNTATNGAGVYNASGDNAIWNNTIADNVATGSGGGLYVADDSPDIRSNAVVENTAVSGAGIFGQAGSTPSLDYNNLFGNVGADYAGTASAGGNDVALLPGLTVTYSLNITSPMAEIGDPTVPITQDYEGDLRPSGVSFDIGADEIGGCTAAIEREFQADGTIYGSIQFAVDQAVDGDTILVEGVCSNVGTRGTPAVTQHLYISKTVTIDGNWDFQDVLSPTIDALNFGRVVYIAPTGSVTLTNLILQFGEGDGAGITNGGGGIYNDGDLRLNNVELHSSGATVGGGIYNAADIAVLNSFLYDNVADNGAAFYNASGTAGITHTALYENQATSLGGAIYQASGDILVDGNRIYSNDAVTGAGLYLTGGIANSVDVRNNFIYRNVATGNGGGLFNQNTNANVWHNSFIANQAVDGAGLSSNGGSPFLRNNLFDGNAGSSVLHASGGSPNSDYNNIVPVALTNYSGIAEGANDISVTPIYADPSEDDYHLEGGSGGLDVGDPAVPAQVDYDIDGDLRPTNGGTDIGADELSNCLIRVQDPGDADNTQIFGVLQDAIDFAESLGVASPTLEMARGECTGVKSGPDGTLQVGYIQQNMSIVGSLRQFDFSFTNDYSSIDVGRLTSRINANEEGRVIYIASGATVSFTHVALVNGDATAANDGNSNGGGLYLESGAGANLDESRIMQSFAADGGGYYGGGGTVADMSGTGLGGFTIAEVSETDLGEIDTVTYIPFDGNVATGDGAGAYISGLFDFRNVGIASNVAGGDGGGLYNSGGGNRLINVYFYQNIASGTGGGLYNSGSNFGAFHNTYVENDAQGGSGGAILNTQASFELNSSIVYSNTAVSGIGGFQTVAGVTNDYNLFFENSPADSAVAFGPNTLLEDPQLFGVSPWYTSPAIDTADPDLLTARFPDLGDDGIDFDINVETRPDVNFNNGSVTPNLSDMGVNEWSKDFACELLAAPAQQTVLPGDIVTFGIDVSNIGTDFGFFTDSITVSLTGQTFPWSILGDDNMQVLLGPFTSAPYTLTVTVPPTATFGMQDVSTVTCTSASNPSRSQSLVLTTIVGEAASIDVEPNYAAAARPGDVLTYTFDITNTGNTAGSFTLIPSPGPQHATADLVDEMGQVLTDTVTVALAPGDSVTQTMRVEILDTAIAGETAVPSLIATDIEDSDNFDSARILIDILPAPATRYVDGALGNDNSNCASPNSPCATLEYAYDQAVAGDEIRLATGTYSDVMAGTINGFESLQTLYIDKSVTIAGGYSTADSFTVQQPLTNVVSLSGQNVRRVVYITTTEPVTLEHLIIESGLALGSEENQYGGGILNDGADLTLNGVIFRNNVGRYGGGLYHEQNNLTVYNSLFVGNANDDGSGAGIGEGGGIYINDGTAVIENNTFVNNQANVIGSLARSGLPTGQAGALFQFDGTLTLRNNIFSQNGGDVVSTVYISPTIAFTADYNLYHEQDDLVTNFITGTNSFTGDPVFIFGDPFYRLDFDSEAKDAGFNGVGTSEDIELDGRPQPAIGGVYDIGADERLQEPRFVFRPVTQTAEISVNTLVTYTHVLTNTGDPTDTYTFTLSSVSTPPGGTWTRILSPSTSVTLARNESVTVTLAISGTQPGYVDETTIEVSSATGLTAQAVDTTRLTQTAGVLLEPDQSGSALPGDTITYTHLLTNTGDGPDSFGLVLTQNNPEWSVTVAPTQTAVLLPNESIPVTVTVTISDGLASGMSNVAVVVATSDVDVSVSDSVTDTTTVATDNRFTLVPDNAQTALSPSQVIYNHTLTNIGNATSSYTLTVDSQPNWLVEIFPTTVTLAPSEMQSVQVTVTVPADTGGVVHLATVTAENGVGITETAVNTTTVQIDLGVDIEPDNSDIVPAGTVLTYSHTVTNTGNITDTYTVTLSSSAGWQSNMLPTTLTLGPGLADTLAVEVTVPGGATPGAEDVTTITVTSQLDNAISDTATDTTRVEQDHGLLFAPNYSSTAQAATQVIYTHTLTNTGNGPDRFALTAQSSTGAVVNLPASPIEVAASDSVSVPVRINLPFGSSGQTDITMITATSVISPAFFATVTNTTVISGEAEVYSGTITPLLSEQFGTIGDNVRHDYTITNTGNITAIFRLEEAPGTGIFGWTTVFPSGVSRFIAPGESDMIRFEVVIPPGATLNDTEIYDLRFIVDLDGGGQQILTTVQNQTTYTDTVVIMPGVELTPNNEAFAQPGTVVTYTHRLTNTGTAADTYTLTALSSNLWMTSIPSPIMLESGEGIDVEVTLTVPLVALGTVDTMTVQATSATDPFPTDTVVNTTTVTDTIPMPLPGLAFAPDRSATADAGTTINFTHFLTNTGDVADTYTIGAQTTNGWTTGVPAPISLESGESETVIVSVDVPVGAAGQTELMTVTATSSVSPTLSASVEDTVEVNGTPGILGVSITPDNAQDANLGDRPFYQHTIQNTGTVTEEFSITAVSSAGWSVTLLQTSVQLAPGESLALGVFIIVPADITADVTDITTITVTSRSDSTVSDSATDTTTVDIPGDEELIYLPLVVYNPDSGPPPPPPATPTPTATPVPCSPTGIDLVVTEIRVEPASPAAGETATVFVTIRNQGSNDVPFGNNFYLDLYINRAPQPITAGDIIWGVQGGDLDAGVSVTFSNEVTFNAGIQQLYAQVDTDNTVDECNFENNNTLGPISIVVSGVARDGGAATNTPVPPGTRETPTPEAALPSETATVTPSPTVTAEAEAVTETPVAVELTPLATAVLVTPTTAD